MRILKLLLFIAIALCVFLILARSQWEGHLAVDRHTWMIEMERTPLWNPPAVPSYGEFKQRFKEISAEATPGLKITRVLRWDWTLLNLILYLWGVTAAFGILYLAVRGARRDVVLHYNLSIAVGLTGAVLMCLALWIVAGGWGPPFPMLFGLLGIVSGVFIARRTYKRAAA